MTLDCKLCGAWCYTTYICVDCNKVKDIINLYSREVVLSVLEKVLIRDEQQRIHKIETNRQLQKKVSAVCQDVEKQKP